MRMKLKVEEDTRFIAHGRDLVGAQQFCAPNVLVYDYSPRNPSVSVCEGDFPLIGVEKGCVDKLNNIIKIRTHQPRRRSTPIGSLILSAPKNTIYFHFYRLNSVGVGPHHQVIGDASF